MKKLFNQIFFLKKSKKQAQCLSTIYLRLTINGTRTEFSTQRQCDPKKWSSPAGRLIGKSEDTRNLNKFLEALEYRIYDIYKELIVTGVEVTGEMIKAKLLGIGERPRMLVEIYQHHNQQFAALVGKEFALGTLKRFKSALASLDQLKECR
ncbi:MAG: Arm DNA-binding domain-containing protein [Bacteroidota bacterium]|nr:Arm DNA-binding domain-containing protein [Bacteroidota bacterium]